MRLHVFVDGRVQGVGFRYFVVQVAELLQVNGWVRNTGDGRVEVMAEGERDVLDKLLEYLGKGPRAAFVSEVRQEWEAATGEFTYFEVRQTY